MVMTAAKKNDSCSASISIDASADVDSLVAALATEDVSIIKDDSSITIEVTSGNLSDLRARLNTALRSLQAASEALIEVDRSA
ncbi:MAG TPA: hypothetical protein D7H97_00660 [Candidatus Poseidoniales archaeon]|jgi:tRNA threonylcarbamoyladenosine modification (KEOPS) complex  Pcc1 subunit|nr:MAG TPA: hypothetical protein D7H97_00660 [Candidatus Poseidoniales archaeon]